MNETEPVINPRELPPPAASTRPSLRRRFWAFWVTRIVAYILVAVLIFLGISAVFNGLLLVAARFFHYRQQGNLFFGTFIGEDAAAVSAVAAFWVMVRFVDKRPWATAGFGVRGIGKELLGGFVLGAAFLSIGVTMLVGVGAYHITGSDVTALVLLPLPLYFVVAVFEEIFFRGYLFQTLEARWGSGVALAATSILFGLAHLNNPIHGVTAFERLMGPLFICLEAGLPLASAYLLTRRWWLPIGLHWAWDYFEGPVYGCPDSGTHDSHSLLHAQLTGPFFVSGGPFGPEAGCVFLVAGTTLGVLLLRAAVRRGQWRSKPHIG